MASDDSDVSGLAKDDVVAGAKLLDCLVSGERISCWRARRSDGSSATVHALARDGEPRERDHFLTGARRIAALSRNRPIAGVVEVVAVVPTELLYVARGGAQGTMEDVFVLGWDVHDTVSFTRRIGHALRELHQLGVVHGCLRPANVLLDDDLDPRLTDAGMLIIDDSYVGPSDMQHDYSAYAAREVRLGQRPDVRSDVFSLGRVLHFALTGVPPEEADEDLPVLNALAEHPAGLVRIIRRCTTREPGRRYPSLDQLLADLLEWQDADRVGLRHPRGLEGDGGADLDEDDVPPSQRGKHDSTSSPAPSSSSRGPTAHDADAAEAAHPKQAGASGQAAAKLGPAYFSASEDDDFISPEQMRIFGVLGAILIVGALALAYVTAMASMLALVGSVLGAVALSLTIPPVGGATVLSRLIAATVLGVVVWTIDPASMVAEAGRQAKLSGGTLAERVTRVEKMRRRGFTNFAGLDLRGADLSGRELAGANFDGCDFRGAKLTGTRLVGSTFHGADFSGADFSGADLTGVEVAVAIGFSNARCDSATVMSQPWQCIDGLPQASAGSYFPDPDEPSGEEPEAN